MATDITGYSTTPASNTTADSVSIAEGMLPSDINNAMRAIMSHIADARTGAVRWSDVTTSITAGTTQSQAGSTALTTPLNHVTTCANSGDGVKLPTAAAGLEVLIVNDGAESCQVWPNTSDAIDGGAADAVDSNTLAAGSSRRYAAVDATTWHTASPAAVDLTAPGPIGSVTPSTGAFTSITGMTTPLSEAQGGTGATSAPTGTNPNLLINGDFQIWQRGISITLGSDALAWGPDRWRLYYGGTGSDRMAFTPGQTDVPGNPDYYWRISLAGDPVDIAYHHEGVTDGAGEDVTLSFWAKSSVDININGNGITQTYAGSANEANDPGDFSVTSTWTKFTATVTMASASGKTVNHATDYLNLAFQSSASYTGTLDIANVKLEVGSSATSFEHESYGETLAKCQRYYWTTGTMADGTFLWQSNSISTTISDASVVPPVPMRTTPTLSYSALSHFKIRESGSDFATPSAMAILKSTTGEADHYRVYATMTAVLTVSAAGWLLSRNASAELEFSAEL